MSKYDYTRLGRDLFTKRGRLGENKSRNKLAKELKINPTTLGHIENGKDIGYNIKFLDAVTEYLGVELKDYKLDDYVE